MIVYIAGPMRGVPYYGYGNFEDVEQRLVEEHKCEVINPHKEDRRQGFDVLKLSPYHNWNDYPPNFDKEACYQRCIDAVKRCDAIYMLWGWERSKGASAEHALAQWMGKTVMYEEDVAFPNTSYGGFHICQCGAIVKNGAECKCTYDKAPCECCGDMTYPDDKTHFCYWTISRSYVRWVWGERAEDDVEYWRKRALETGNPENKGVEEGKPSNTENPKDAIGSGKLPIHLWPTTATMMGCIGFLNGMLKYGRANFRAVGVRSSIYYDACRRHIDAWFEGEDIDPDDNVPHLAAALCCLAIIVDADAAGKLNDDRNFPGGYRKLRDELSPLVTQLKEKHKGRDPKHYTVKEAGCD